MVAEVCGILQHFQAYIFLGALKMYGTRFMPSECWYIIKFQVIQISKLGLNKTKIKKRTKKKVNRNSSSQRASSFFIKEDTRQWSIDTWCCYWIRNHSDQQMARGYWYHRIHCKIHFSRGQYVIALIRKVWRWRFLLRITISIKIVSLEQGQEKLCIGKKINHNVLKQKGRSWPVGLLGT